MVFKLSFISNNHSFQQKPKEKTFTNQNKIELEKVTQFGKLHSLESYTVRESYIVWKNW